MVWEESELVLERVNRELGTQALLTKMAIGASLDKEAGKEFSKQIARLIDGKE